jgi:hypothetical protein
LVFFLKAWVKSSAETNKYFAGREKPVVQELLHIGPKLQAYQVQPVPVLVFVHQELSTHKACHKA